MGTKQLEAKDDSRVKLMRVIWHRDLEALIRETFGDAQNYELIDEFELCNGLLIDDEVSSDPYFIAETLRAFETEDLNLHELLALLHHHGKLEAGELCIHVWW